MCPELRRLSGKFIQAFRRPQHLVGVPADSRPRQGANLIDDLGWARSAINQIAAVDNQVRRDLPQVGEDGFKRPKVPVDVRYDCDSHIRRELYSR
jgi:hypothetical protein